jgi:hypothetical protein
MSVVFYFSFFDIYFRLSAHDASIVDSSSSPPGASRGSCGVGPDESSAPFARTGAVVRRQRQFAGVRTAGMDGADRFMFWGLVVLFLGLLAGVVVALVL